MSDRRVASFNMQMADAEMYRWSEVTPYLRALQVSDGDHLMDVPVRSDMVPVSMVVVELQGLPVVRIRFRPRTGVRMVIPTEPTEVSQYYLEVFGGASVQL